jgi:hypothetical protein
MAGAVASERIWTLAPSRRVAGGIEDDLLARVHSEIRFHPCAEVARHSELADLSLAVVDHRVLQPIAVEDDRQLAMAFSRRTVIFCGRANHVDLPGFKLMVIVA